MRTYTQALLFAVMTALTATSALARDRDDNPPGPAGGPGTNWENPPGPAGGPGASPDIQNHHRWLRQQMTQSEWRHFMTLKYEERHRFCVQKRIPKDRCWFDRDDNPPGPRGGPGTNWENPPGPAGGPGASPDIQNHHRWLRQQMTQSEWRHFMALKYEERHRFCVQKRIPKDRCWFDRDDNPPGPRGGPGTNWENPAGPMGGPGASPNRR